MFANFSEETATGTGAALALAGATTGNIAFGKSFANGDLVAYIVEDSGGTIKVAGIGTYVSSTDEITRNDTWNWNGTVIDDAPTTNITLSGGSHTVRCDITKATSPLHIPQMPYGIIPNGVNATFGAVYGSYAINTIYLVPFEMKAKQTFTSIEFKISAAAASSFTRLGVYTAGQDGFPLNLLVDSGAIDSSTTGIKSATIDLDLSPGLYYFASLSDGAIDPITGSGNDGIIGHSTTAQVAMIYKTQTYGALPSSLSGTYTINTNRPLYIAMD